MCGGQTYFFLKYSLNPQVYTRLIAAMRLVSDYNEVVAAMRSPRFIFFVTLTFFVTFTLISLLITLFPLSLQNHISVIHKTI